MTTDSHSGRTGEQPGVFPRHLLDAESLTLAQLETILTLAARFKKERAAVREVQQSSQSVPPPPQRNLLAGRTVVTLFFEASTRTRSSFETAARALGAGVIALQKEGTSLSKGETLADTAKNLEAVGVDALILRHPFAGTPHQVAREVKVSVVNAGDGQHEHPTQALLDALTLREALGDLKGRTVAIVGDIAHSRVARSNIHTLGKLGAKVRVAGPRTLLPIGIEKLGCDVMHSLDAALDGVDAVMALRIQQERISDARLPSTRDYSRLWGIQQRHVDRLPAHAVVLHPGPVNRGVELASDVLDGPRSRVMEQVDSGVAVRMAVLALCLRAITPAEVAA
ncbi:MAG: aspartate carbamoyltransferase catalytic subunit [Deltaproteobacteria bacterium]|nr:aspartate carbamoyltransferase catalytic subunit [Deltaproteobacteria bacterium]